MATLQLKCVALLSRIFSSVIIMKDTPSILINQLCNPSRVKPVQRSLTTPLPSSSGERTPSSQRKPPKSDEKMFLSILNGLGDSNVPPAS